MTTGEKIRNIRQNAGYTQEQLAEKLLVSRQAIAKWEADRGVPDIENLKAISNHFNLSVDDLLNPDIEVGVETSAETEDNIPAENFDFSNEYEAVKKENKIVGILKNKKVLLGLTAIVVAIALILVTFNIIIPQIKNSINFKKAEALMDKGKYIAAADIFVTIPTDEAEENYNACRYAYAKELYNKGDYENAISEIDYLDYKDSAELYNVWRYEYALYNTKNGEYLKAIELFEALGEYENSADKADELYYYYACTLYNERNFSSAADYFKKTTRDTDSAHYVNSRLNYAIDKFNNGEYGQSFNILNGLFKQGYGDYKNIGTVAASALQVITVAGVLWERTTPISSDNYSFNVSLIFDVNNKLTISGETLGENISFEFNLGYIAPDDELIEMGVDEVLVFGVDSSVSTVSATASDSIYLTFNFLNNTEANIHFCFTDDSCNEFCGKYKVINESVTEAIHEKYITESIDYAFTEITLPEISFADEFPEEKENMENKTESGSDSADAVESTEKGTEDEKETTTDAESKESTSSATENTSGKPSVSSSTSTSGTTSSKNNTSSSAASSKVSSTSSNKNTSSQSGSTSSKVTSTTSQATTNNKCSSGHTWGAVTEVVHHDEVGHYEDVEVANKVTKYVCPLCSYSAAKYSSVSAYYSHFDSAHKNDSNSSFWRERYETKEEYDYSYEKQWIVDKEAYDERVITGYKCSVCGATK